MTGVPVRTPRANLPATPAVLPPGVQRFSDLSDASAFYFLADTNRNFLWVKTSANTASNTVNQKVATLPTTALVRAQTAAGDQPAQPVSEPANAERPPAPAAAEPPLP